MRRGFFVLCLSLIGGCATITKGTTQSISISAPGAAGASCILSSSAMAAKSIVTPAVLTVEKTQQNIAVHCTKECFQEGSAVITSFTEGMTAGNIIAGGVIGLGVDAATGAMNHYADDTVIVMTPIQGCRAKA